MKLRLALATCVLLATTVVRADYGDHTWLDAVEINASVSGTTVTLSWIDDTNSTTETYTIYKKAFGSPSWGSALTTTGNLFYNDTLAVGATAEYKIVKNTPRRAFGYTYVGNKAPPVTENRGKVMLVVESNLVNDATLASKLVRLENDLRGDGWTVVRKNVPRHDPLIPSRVTTVKNLIVSESSLNAVFLFGRVPIPYSGVINNDGHGDHTGAFPADVYYADVNGTWTDSSKNHTGATYARQNNTPGDGKFDQDTLPSDADLIVGRVDLAEMTCFNNPTDPPNLKRDEIALLKQYLDKNHNFRHKAWNLRRRGLVVDEWGWHGGEGYAASGYRNHATFVGPANNYDLGPGSSYWAEVNSQSYLATWCGGGGGFVSCGSFGTTDQFQAYDPRVVFAGWFGSYFSDWDNESAYLRGPLGSTTYTLASFWSGRPHWFMHHMGLGETIGFSTRLSQNNNGHYESTNNSYSRYIHIALMGDPTLRLHTVKPITGLGAGVSGSTVTLNWTAPVETSVKGYYIYRASSQNGPYLRQNSAVHTSTTYPQSGLANGTYYYMVRTAKLEGEINNDNDRTGSGTYTNLSQGVFATATVGTPPENPVVFLSEDSTTQGEWDSNYGSEGHNVIGDDSNYPTYASVSSAGNTFHQWHYAPTDAGSLFRVTNPSQRIAACWYNGSQFTININIPGTVPKKVALYFHDWDVANRSQTVFVEDAVTGAQYDVRTMNGFSNGKYLSWNVYGNLRFRIVNNLSTLNAVVSGIFFGPGSTTPSGNSAVFVGTDTTTKGTWRPSGLVYGQDGYHVIGNVDAVPTYATVTPVGKADYTWSSSTSDVRALQKAAPATDRISSVWYSPGTPAEFSVNLTISGGTAKRVALYFNDWDGTDLNKRNQQVEIYDGSTLALLDSRPLPDFRQGTWLVWNINGSVIIKCIKNSGNNAILNGLFFGQ